MKNSHDIVIVGGGHAGVEASYCCSKFNKRVLLITNSIDNISKLSCNPSIGGVGKSQLVREIDILGGIMGRAADLSCNSIKTLNLSKGYAVRSTRIQIDKYLYPLNVKKILFKSSNLRITQGNVKKITIENNSVKSIITDNDEEIFCKCLILTNGTFMRSIIHSGDLSKKLCRDYENYYNELSLSLNNYIPGLNRFRTGTPPRIDSRTVDFRNIEKEKIEKKPSYFSLLISKKNNNNIDCWRTTTNEKTRNYVIKNIKKSALFSGRIKSLGPKYCPSIEDKYIRFPKNRKHNIFLELESIYSKEIYPSGLSTSFDFKSQKKIVKTIKGLEKSVITRFGYSIEYDFFNPIHLKKNLESKYINGLFMAGQINGTTGYEEAASQGLYAGINSIKFLNKEKPFILKRKKSYIGILVDDITKFGIVEPYRMFTSRAENRILIREDNVIDRLLKKSYKNNLISYKNFKKLSKLKKSLNNIIIYIKKKKIYYKNKKLKIFDFVKNNFLNINFLYKKLILKKDKDYKNIKIYSKNNIINYINSEIKYSSYSKRILKENYIINYRNLVIPKNFNFKLINGISNELIEKIKKKKIKNIIDIEKIPGVTPVCIYNIKNSLIKNKI